MGLTTSLGSKRRPRRWYNKHIQAGYALIQVVYREVRKEREEIQRLFLVTFALFAVRKRLPRNRGTSLY